MAQLKYRGNLSAKVFPFLASQFGPSVIMMGQDQVRVNQVASEASEGDVGVAQAYYMHNVVPTAQGYKSVGYNNILPPAGVNFDRVINTRDPDMTRGWIGITTSGAVYMFTAGDGTWTNVSSQVPGWPGGAVSVAYANGYTYLCLAGFAVYKLDVKKKLLNPAALNGLTVNGIVAITSAFNYLIVSDGVTIYWSSTVTPEDFVPSTITGAGSGKPSDLQGLIVALVPLSNGFAVYSATNVVIASYSQNAMYPWIFRGADNSRGVASVQHITYSSDDGTNYAWTSAGLQKISATGATTFMGEVTDFLTGQEFEDFDSTKNTFTTSYTEYPFVVKLAFIGARYLVISYGKTSLTHALVYDTALKRWGKLKIKHAACFEFTLKAVINTTENLTADPKKTIGMLGADGNVKVCNFENNAQITDSVIILGKFQALRSRTCTMQSVGVESIEKYSDFSLWIATTFDGKTLNPAVKLTESILNPKYRQYDCRITGLNHSLIFKGKFNLNAFTLAMTLNGRR